MVLKVYLVKLRPDQAGNIVDFSFFIRYVSASEHVRVVRARVLELFLCLNSKVLPTSFAVVLVAYLPQEPFLASWSGKIILLNFLSLFDMQHSATEDDQLCTLREDFPINRVGLSTSKSLGISGILST